MYTIESISSTEKQTENSSLNLGGNESEAEVWYSSEGMVNGVVMVTTDMSCSLISVLLNLMVLNALREKEHLLTRTHNLILGNICCANLISAVFVKSISIVHHGYAVTAQVTESHIAFCSVYKLGHRVTWAVLPWSVALLAWLGPHARIMHIKETLRARRKTEESQINSAAEDGIFLELAYLSGRCGRRDTVSGISTRGSIRSVAQSHTDSGRVSRADTELETGGKLSGRDKAVLGWLWTLSSAYGIMNDQLLTKVVDKPCDVREPVSGTLGIVSLVFGLIIPFLLGPVAASVTHLALNVLQPMWAVPSLDKEDTDRPDRLITLMLGLIYIPTYTMAMLVTELTPAIYSNPFLLVMLKYVLGTGHHSLVPLVIIAIRQDLRDLIKVVFKKGGSTQSKGMDMTYEEIQRELGIGVEIN